MNIWQTKKIENVIEGFHNGVWGEEISSDKKAYPIIRSTEITNNGRIDISTVAYRKIEDSKVDRFLLKDGDILLVSSSGSFNLIGRAAIFKQPLDGKQYLFSNFMLRLRPKDIEPYFLYYFLNSPKYKNLLKTLQQTSTGLRNFPKKEFLALEILVPSVLEQKQIIKVLQSIDEAIIKKEEAVKKVWQIKKGLIDDLITGKKRVRMD